MTKFNPNDRITKLAKQREVLKKQIKDSQQKIDEYETKLAQVLGQLALTHHLDQLSEESLNAAFADIAKSHQLT